MTAFTPKKVIEVHVGAPGYIHSKEVSHIFKLCAARYVERDPLRAGDLLREINMAIKAYVPLSLSCELKSYVLHSDPDSTPIPILTLFENVYSEGTK